MSPRESESESCQIVEVNWEDRWLIYQRLQELGISCWCGTEQPLRVQVRTATDMAQLASVLKQITASRHYLVTSLERCWQGS